MSNVIRIELSELDAKILGYLCQRWIDLMLETCIEESPDGRERVLEALRRFGDQIGKRVN
jgi:hypothetical protein